MSKQYSEIRGQHARGAVRGASRVARSRVASSLTLKPVTAAVLAVLGTGLSAAALAAPGGNHIVADGRTKTHIAVNGGTTDITTHTVSGADAFNSFSQFKEAAGNQVNLYLPTNTENLVNLVTGGPTEIDGILNSYKNGQIGGRVFFADSYGMVVGAQGVINVGALSVSAPTQQFMNQLMGADGSVNSSALSALLSGTEPLSSDGKISIQGEVHALDAVRLRAEKVDASGLIWVMGGDGSDALAGDAVNIQGAAQGAALVNHGGTIKIVSAGDAAVSGSLQANGGANQSGGGITVLAGQNANIGGSAQLSAKGQGSHANGGQITIKSGNDTTVGNGAHFIASAGSSGDGGSIEVSAANNVSVGSVAFDASATNGHTGSVLFDPVDQSSINGTITTNGSDFDDEDATSIKVTSTGKIDTTSTTGAAGSITLGAPSISIDTGGQLIASDGVRTPGDITLTAEQDQSVGSGLASASTSITVNGTLNGGDIDIDADASGTASYSSVADSMETVQDTLASMPSDWASKLSLATDSFLAGLLPVGVDIGAASASIDIQGGADIQADGDLTIASSTDTKASMPALNSVGGTPLVAAAVYGEVYGNATTTVDTGATLSVGGSNTLTVQATNKDELEVSATVNSDADSVDITAAVGYANVTSNATIAAGANVNAANVVVLAHNSNSFGVDSSVAAAEGGKAGIAAAVSITNTHATAQENANLGSTAMPIDSLVVDASSSAEQNKTGADTSVGGEASGTTPADVVTSGGEALPDYLQELLGKELTKADEGTDTTTGSSSNSSEPSTSPFKLGSAISVADSSQNASASIGANAQVAASGQVAVHSSVEDDDVHNSAASEVTSSEKSGNAASLSVSAGISVGLYEHDAAASIGTGAVITSPEIGVGSDIDIPWDLDGLNQWDGLSTLNTAVSDLLEKSGAPIMTSYVDAQSDTGDVGLAGAVSYLSMQNTSTAWVSSGATLQCNTASQCTPNTQANWTTPPVQYGTDETSGDPLTDSFSWTLPFDIAADNSVETLNDAGNFSLMELNGTGGEENSKSVGGGFDDVNYINTTIAGVAANAVISVPAESLAVNADSSDTAITVTPTAGRGSGVSANVIMAMANVDNITHASISNAAQVTAGEVDVNAHEGMNIWTIAGAISQGSSAGVGVGVGVNNLKTSTQAYIGDNTCDTPGAAASCTPANTSGGQIKADALNVQALTDGQSGAIAVSGSAATGSDESGGSGSGGGGSGGGGSGSGGSSGASLGGALGFINTTAEFLSNFPALKSVSDQVTQTTSSLTTLNTIVGKATATESKESGKNAGSDGSGGEQQEGPKFGIAISGSATVNIANLTTKGYVDGVTVTPDQDASNNVSVNGLNNTFLISASGAGALASAKNSSSKFSAGIAGAVAFSLIQNSTDAYIDDATLTDVDGLAVQALSGGSEVDLGLGLAVNTSSSSNSVSVSGSFSLSGVQNNTSANLSSDTVTGSGSATSAANVMAYDNTAIGAGGGSLSVGGKGAAGIAVTLSDIGNLPGTTPTTPYGEEAAINGGMLSGFDNLNVEGLDSSRIVDGAVAVAATSKTLALTGEFVFNNIGEVTSGSIGGGADVSGITGTVTVAGAGVDPNGTTPDGSSVGAFNTLLTGDGSPVDASLIDFSGVSLLGGSGAPLGSAIYGVVGGVSVGKNAAGLAFVLNNIANDNSATVSNATLSTASNGAVNLDAANNAYILGLAVGVGVSTGNFAGVGSVTANLINDSATATLGDTSATPTTTTVTAGSLGINATNGANINALAGNVAISTGSVAAGVAIGFNEIGDQTGATLDNATTNTSGATTVAGTSNGSIESAAVAGAVGDDVALSGSFSINDIGTDDLGSSSIPQTYTNATIENSTVTAASLNDEASDSATIKTLSGAIAASSDAAIGAAFTLDNISDDTNAEVNSSVLTVGGSTGVNAKSTSEIDGIAVGGAGSGDLAIVGSFTLNAIANGLDAGMSGVTMNAAGDQTGKVQVTATDQSQIESLAGAVAISGGAGVGVSLAFNSIGDTANAHVDGGNYDVTDLTVQALSQDPNPGSANIQTIAAGVGGGADIGGAASVAVNLLTGGTSAYIDNGAKVTAADNVGVIANTQQGVDVLAGSVGIGVSAAAVGVGAVVNYLDNGTSAYISGSSTQVTANAANSADSLTVGTGTLANPPDVDSVQSMSDYVTPDLSETTQQVQGVVVNASTEQNAATLGISAALSFDIGSVSLAVMGNANVIGGTTSAYVDSAKVTSGQDLDVNASNHSYDANFDLGVAASGGFSGAAAVSVNSFNHKTDAYVSDATTDAKAVNVNAQATQDAVGLTAGLAGGIVGAAGTGIVNIFDDDTSAYVDQGSLAGDSLTVNANSEDDANLFGGAGAIGGAAVAGTFVLAVSENNTSAYVGDDKNDTNLSLTGALDVEADSTTNTSSLTVSGSAAGGVGVAGMAVVNVVQNHTNAYLDRAQLNQKPSQSGSGAITVKANEHITLKPYTGAVAGGGTAGVGAAANLAILQSQVGATVTDSKLNSADAVQVEALSSKDIEPITVTAGVGGTAGISGGASLILFGSGSTGSGNTDVMSQLGGTLGKVSSFGSQNNISDPSGSLSSSQSSQLQQDTGYTLLNTGGALPGSLDGTSALISGSTVTASSVSVEATDTTYTKSITGALAAGGVGAGAAIGYTGLYDQVTALVDSSSVLTTPSLTVSATEQDGSGHAAEVDTYEGAGGLVGLGVSAAVANVNNTVTAGAGGILSGNKSSGGAVNVTATDSSSLSTTGAGASVGIAAAGLVITQSNKSSSVTAELGDAGGDTANASGFNSISLNASDKGAVAASSTGGSGGLGVAADGADANATDSATVIAQVGKNATITTPATGSVSVQASDTPDTSANVIGVSVAGGIGLAVSVATAEVNHSVTSTVLNSASITGPGSLSISASSTPDAGNDPTAYAKAIAGGGGVLAGADGSVAIADSGGYDSNFSPESSKAADVAASTGSNVTLPDGAVSITATNTTNQSSDATGVAAGFLAVGATVSQSGANTSTTATLGDQNQTSTGRDGSLTLTATGTDTNAASSTAGSGGAIAGNASVAQTDDTSTVNADIGSLPPAGTAPSLPAPMYAGSLTVAATHTDNYAAYANSVNAAALGASGSDSINNANSNVNLDIGQTDLLVGGAVSLASRNFFDDTHADGVGDGTNAAGGGGATAQATQSKANLTGNATVELGDAVLESLSGVPLGTIGMDIVAGSTLTSNDNVVMDTGGAFDGSGGNSELDATLNNNVLLDPNVALMSDGDLNVGTYTTTNADNSTLIHTWGLAAAGAAYATTNVTTNQNVSVGSGDLLQAWGNINLTAGQDPTGTGQTRMTSDAIAQSYVRGLIAVPIGSASTTLTNNASLNVAGGATVESATNVAVGAYDGNTNGAASGTGHGYELGFIPVDSHKSHVNQPTCGSQCSSVNLDGTIIAGMYYDTDITISGAGTPSSPIAVSWAPGTGAPFTIGCESTPTCLSAATSTSANDADMFQPINWVTTNFPNYDKTLLGLIEQTVSTDSVPVVFLNNLFASGGNISVQAGSLAGSGTLTAHGGAQINVNDHSPAYVVLGPTQTQSSFANTPPTAAYITDEDGGQVSFTGAAGSAPSGMTVNQSPGQPQVNINLTWNQQVGNPQGGQGPAVFVAGNILNQAGLVSVHNASGSYASFYTTFAQQSLIDAPRGAVVIGQPGLPEFVGGDAASQNWPNMSNLGNADWAVAYIANSEFSYLGGGNTATSSGDFTNRLLNQPGPYWFNSDSANTLSYVLYSSCAAAATVDCSENPDDYSNGESPLGYSVPLHNWWYPVVPVVATSESWNLSTTPPPVPNQPGGITAQVVGIVGNLVDVDAPITAGNPTNWSVQISSNLESWAQAYCTTGTCPLVDNNGKVATYNGTPLLTTSGSGDQLIGASYDSTAQQVVLNNVNASGGGFVYIKGGIISTNTQGLITVNSGFGRVTVDNNSGAKVQINNVDAGSNPVGEVELVDTLKSNSQRGPLTTWYLYTEGQGLNIYDNAADSATTLTQAQNNPADLIKSTSVADSSYQPLLGERLNWGYVGNLSRSYGGTTGSYAGPWTWSTGNGVGPGNHYQYVNQSGGVTGNNGTTPAYWLSNDSAEENTEFTQSVNGYFPNYFQWWITYHGCKNGSCHWGFPPNWFYNIVTGGTIYISDSAKADFPIGISFQGNAQGNISIQSNNNVVLNGQINNPSGCTSIGTGGNCGNAGSPQDAIAGSITQTAQASLLTHDLGLNATGSIGEGSTNPQQPTAPPQATTPLQASLTGGVVNAAAGSQGVFLSFGTAARLGTIQSFDTTGGYGPVYVQASGDLLSANTGLISGSNISLVSTSGAIGTDSDSLLISAEPQAGSALNGGEITAHALNDINLVDLGGDLYVNQIASDAGNVSLLVPFGAILDANSTTAGATLTSAQLDQIWKSLNLVAGSSTGLSQKQVDDNVAAKSVTPFENLVNSSYQQYWQLLGNGTVVNGQFQLNSSSIALYRPLVQAADKLAGAPTTEQVQTYANNQYQNLVQFFNNNLADGWQSTADFTSFHSGYSYTATATQQSAFEQNADWQQAWLQYAISENALQPSNATLVGTATPNISGRQVTLLSGNGIGQLGLNLPISVQDILSGNLTQQQQAALAMANTPGDVTLTLTGQTVTGLNIQQTEPLFGSVTGALTVHTGGAIYLQANGNLALKDITAGGDIRLAADGNITNAAPAGQAAVTTVNNHNLILVSGTGSIGTPASGSSAAQLLPVQISGSLLSASAGQDVLINQLRGNLVVGQVYSANDIDLEAGSSGASIVASSAAGALNLIAQNDITLTAADDMGSPAQPLQVQGGGEVSGQAIGGNAYLYSPSAALQISSLAAGGDLTVTTGAGQALSATSLASGGLMDIASGNNATLGALVSQRGLTISALGSATLANGESATGNVSVNTGDEFDVTTLTAPVGAVLINATGDMNLATGGKIASGDQQVLNAGSLEMGAGSSLQSAGAISITTSVHQVPNTGGGIGAPATIATSGGMVLGAVDSTLANGMALSLDAAGAILGNGDGQTNLTAATGAQTQLQAGSGIGQVQLPLQVMLPWLQADTQSGGIYIHDLESLSAPSGLQAGADINLNVTGDLAFGSVTAGGSAALNASGNLSGTTLKTGSAGDATVNGGGDVMLTTLDAGASASVGSGGKLSVNTATVGQDLNLNSVNGIGFQQLAAGGDINAATTQGDILGGSLDAGGGMDLSGVNIQLDDAQSGTTLALTAQQTLNASTLGSGGSMNLQAGGTANVNTLSAGGDFTLQSNGDFSFQQLTAGGHLTGSSQADILGGSLNAGGGVDLSGVNLRLQGMAAGSDVVLAAQQALQVGDVTVQGGGANLTATDGDLAINQLTVSGAAGFTTGGALSLGEATSGGDMSLASVGDLHFQQLTAGGGLTGSSQADILGGSLKAGGGVNLSGVNIQLDKAQAGADLSLTAQQALNASALTAGGSAMLQAGSVNLGSLSAGQGINFQSKGDFSFQQLTAGGKLTGSSQGNILGGSIKTGGTLTLSGVNLVFQNVTAGGEATLTAQQTLRAADIVVTNGGAALTAANLRVAKLTTSGSQALQSAGPLTLGTITSGKDLSLVAGGDIQFQQLTAGGDMSVSSQADILGGSLTAANADLSAPDNIQLSSANVGHSLNLAAADISADVKQTTSTSPLLMSLGGFKGGVADKVALEVNASDGLTLVLLKAKQAQINTTAEQVAVNQGYIPDWFYLITPSTMLLLDNTSVVPALRPVDVQLYQPGYGFQLVQNGKNTSTDSYVVHYQHPYEVQVPNYDSAHIATGPAYGGESAVRNAFRTLMDNFAPLDTSQFGIQAIINPDGTVSYPSLMPQTVTTSVQGAVNTGSKSSPVGSKR